MFIISSGYARHIPVYCVYISVKGSRVCKPFNVLAVRKYVRASIVCNVLELAKHLVLPFGASLEDLKECSCSWALKRTRSPGWYKLV